MRRCSVVLVLVTLALFMLAARKAPVGVEIAFSDVPAHVRVPFTITVSGLEPDAHAKICIVSQVCVGGVTDDAGVMTQEWELDYPFVYTVHVYQGNTVEQDPQLVAEGTIEVVDP